MGSLWNRDQSLFNHREVTEVTENDKFNRAIERTAEDAENAEHDGQEQDLRDLCASAVHSFSP